MQQAISSAESTALARLWRRRQTLSSNEMGQMYRIVGGALKACNPPELHALGEGRQELVAQFIYVKVLRLDADPDEADDSGARDRGSHSAPSNAFALCAYFRRYLIDCTRASAFRKKLSIGDEVTEAQLEDQLGAHHDADAVLSEHGLSADAVERAARGFIAGLPQAERLLLCEGFGQEAEGGLSGIASRHAIASYHYRAGRLGLVHKRAGLTADYARTTLGQWISGTLGIEIEADNMAAILQVFKILGAQASYA